jgi:hypothetical protein
MGSGVGFWLRTYPKSRFKRVETTDVDAKRLAEGYTDEHR